MQSVITSGQHDSATAQPGLLDGSGGDDADALPDWLQQARETLLCPCGGRRTTLCRILSSQMTSWVLELT